MLSRRAFLQTTAVASVAAASAADPKKLAVLAGTYQPDSAAQHMADRFLIGYARGGAWHMPSQKVAALYVDQKAGGDLSEDRAREFGFRVWPQMADALRRGGKTLDVDAVLISAGEADDASSSLLGQCVNVFEQDGRAVPVFCDGPLSYDFTKARAAVDASRRLKFPLLAGSSIPVTFRLPDLELPLGCDLEDALMVGTGTGNAAIFAALEGLQCMAERRRGGESGVKSVQMLEDDAVWKAGFSKPLLTAALSRSDTLLGLTVTDGRTQDLVASGLLPELVKTPAAFLIQYRDGFQATLLMLDGAVKDLNFAGRLRSVSEIQSTQFLLTPLPSATYSGCLMPYAEHMFETGVAPYPVERSLLVSGILESGLLSKARNHAAIPTPHLNLAYKPSGKAKAT